MKKSYLDIQICGSVTC